MWLWLLISLWLPDQILFNNYSLLLALAGFCSDLREQTRCEEACGLPCSGNWMAREASHFSFAFGYFVTLPTSESKSLNHGRLESGGRAGSNLMPLRPVCVLVGNLDMEPNQILQIM